MAGTLRRYLNGSNLSEMGIEQFKNLVRNPFDSAEVDVSATGETNLVTVPAGMFAKVSVMATDAVSGTDVDIGDSDAADTFVDGLTTLALNEVVAAPIPAAGVGTAEAGGKYYATSDTIKATVNSAGTGKLKIIVDMFKV